MMPSEFQETQRKLLRARINRGIQQVLFEHKGKRTLNVCELVSQLRGKATRSAIEAWRDPDLEFFTENGVKCHGSLSDYCKIRITEKPKSRALKKTIERVHREQVEIVKSIMSGEHDMCIDSSMEVRVPFTALDLFRRDKNALERWGLRVDGIGADICLQAYATDSMVQERFKLEQMTSEASETTENE